MLSRVGFHGFKRETTEITLKKNKTTASQKRKKKKNNDNGKEKEITIDLFLY